MRRLVIVDDETNIRAGLAAMIERRFPGRYHIALAAEGAAALDMVRRDGADIVITDIRMPGMDGIELIGQLDELACKPLVIILSGYDDFAYAKAAIKLNVKEYLLKPIVREELFAALERAVQELEKQANIAARLDKTDSYMEELRRSQLDYMLLSSDITPEEVRAIAERLQLAALAGHYAVVRLRDESAGFGGRESTAPRGLEPEEFRRRIKLRLDAYGGMDGAFRLLHSDKDGSLLLLTSEPGRAESLLEQADDGLVCSGAISGVHSDLGMLKVACDEARHALKYRFLHVAPGWFRYSVTTERRPRSKAPVDDIRKLGNMLGSGRESEMRQLLHGIFDERALGELDIVCLEEVAAKMNELVFDKVFHVYGEASVHILKIYRQVGSMYSFPNVYEYVHNVEHLLFRLNDYIKHVKSAHIEHYDLKAAVAYIEQNYSCDLNMATVSNHISMNYSYFSQAFKEYTGENFVNFLRKVRIGRAMELLKGTNDKVYEVGEKVGYGNVKQFNRAFREVAGVTPLEYRNGC